MPHDHEALRDADTPIKILYRNWRGETAVRSITNGLIRPDEDGGTQLGMTVWFGSTEWHPEPQWFLRAADVEKSAYRDFAMADILAWGADAITRHRSKISEETARAGEGIVLPSEEDFSLLIHEAVCKHSDLDDVSWTGVARYVAKALRSPALSLTEEAGHAER